MRRAAAAGDVVAEAAADAALPRLPHRAGPATARFCGSGASSSRTPAPTSPSPSRARTAPDRRAARPRARGATLARRRRGRGRDPRSTSRREGDARATLGRRADDPGRPAAQPARRRGRARPTPPCRHRHAASRKDPMNAKLQLTEEFSAGAARLRVDVVRRRAARARARRPHLPQLPPRRRPHLPGGHAGRPGHRLEPGRREGGPLRRPHRHLHRPLAGRARSRR